MNIPDRFNARSASKLASGSDSVQRTRLHLLGSLLSTVCVAVLVGCSSAPTSSGPPKLTVPPGVTLPIPARVAVEVDPSMTDMQTVEYRGYTWQYADADLMGQAGMKVFREMFTEVGAPQSLSAPVITIRLNGYSSVNPVMNEYYGSPTATIFSGSDTYTQPVAVYSGNGTASQPNFERAGISQAYEAAFREIGNRMLADPSLLMKLRGK